MNPTIVIPFRSDDPERHHLKDWVCARWAALHPDWPLIVESDGALSGPFNRSRAVNRGVAKADTDTVIIADADIAIRHGQAQDMVDSIDDGWWAWVVGYSVMLHLRDVFTANLLAFCPPETNFEPVQNPWVRWGSRESVCGLVALRRREYEAIGCNDEAFTGWGWEDTAFAIKADTLLGPYARVEGECHHLYHHLREDRKTDPQAQANRRRFGLYRRAAGDTDAMWALARERITA